MIIDGIQVEIVAAPTGWRKFKKKCKRFFSNKRNVGIILGALALIGALTGTFVGLAIAGRTYEVLLDYGYGPTELRHLRHNQAFGMDAAPHITREYHTFAGWYLAPGFAERVTPNTLFTSRQHVMLQARWIPDSYTVSIDRGNYAGLITDLVNFTDALTVFHGEIFEMPQRPSSRRHDFLGFFSDPNLLNPFDFGAEITGGFTIFTKWDLKRYTVNFISELWANSIVSSVRHGDDLQESQIPAFPEKLGYLGSWAPDPKSLTDLSSDHEINAVYELDVRTLIIHGGLIERIGVGSVVNLQQYRPFHINLSEEIALYAFDANHTFFDFVDPENYEFRGWKINGTILQGNRHFSFRAQDFWHLLAKDVGTAEFEAVYRRRQLSFTLEVEFHGFNNQVQIFTGETQDFDHNSQITLFSELERFFEFKNSEMYGARWFIGAIELCGAEGWRTYYHTLTDHVVIRGEVRLMIYNVRFILEYPDNIITVQMLHEDMITRPAEIPELEGYKFWDWYTSTTWERTFDFNRTVNAVLNIGSWTPEHNTTINIFARWRAEFTCIVWIEGEGVSRQRLPTVNMRYTQIQSEVHAQLLGLLSNFNASRPTNPVAAYKITTADGSDYAFDFVPGIGTDLDVFVLTIHVVAYTQGLSFSLTTRGGAPVYSVSAGSATGNIVIPKAFNFFPVAEIAGFGFSNNLQITEVVIPQSVEFLGDFAFAGSVNLVRIVYIIPREAPVIEGGPFVFAGITVEFVYRT
jgi:hypothetical protein